MKAFLRTPLLHFFVAALAIMAGLGASPEFLPAGRSAAARPSLDLSPAWLASLCRDELARSGAYASGRELAALARRQADDELLLREAVSRGYDRTDPVVAARLVSNLRFVSADSGLSAKAALEKGLALGMPERDLVARRRLIGRLRLEIEGDVRRVRPSNAELRTYLRRHQSSYLLPERIRISHIYFAAGSPARDAAAKARRLREELSSGRILPRQTAALGDPFLEGRDLAPLSKDELARSFGNDFAVAVARAPTQRWIGPLTSPYGEHLVWIHERVSAHLPAFEEIRERLTYDWWQERARAELARTVERLRDRYQVRLDGERLEDALAAMTGGAGRAAPLGCREILERAASAAATARAASSGRRQDS